MSFSHDEREDLWRYVWDIWSNPVKTPEERQQREHFIEIVMNEI